jgi:hypothetical protein
MPRWIIIGLLLVSPSIVHSAELPIVAPQPIQGVPPSSPSTAPTPVPVPGPVPAAGQWTVSCQPASACAEPCRAAVVRKPGILTGLKNWLCGTGPIENCDATCPTPMVRVVVSEPCPAPVACPTTYPKPIIPRVLPTRPTVECPKVDAAPVRRFPCAAAACEKFKSLLCWKPCNEQLLPVLCPAPYHAPATAYLGPNREPAAPLPCGTCKKPAKAPCETGACAPAVAGPIVANRAHPVMGGWTPINANYPPVVPAAATVPVKAPTNPLARPFTSP